MVSTIASVDSLPDADSSDLRRAMGRFTTGVGVVLTEAEGEPHGATINSLTWISLTPPLILVSLASASSVARAVHAARAYSVSILGSSQTRIAEKFAKPADGKFDNLPMHRGSIGLPIVPGALSTMECSVEREIEVGDHFIFIGRVHSAAHRSGEPLAFYSGRFGRFLDPEGELDIWI